MRIDEVLTQYQFSNLGQFRGIAKSLGYKEEYNSGDLLFSRGGDEQFRITATEVRSHTNNASGSLRVHESMDRVCQFYDKENILSYDYTEELCSKHEIDIINWGEIGQDTKDRFTIIDHKNKVCYTGKAFYDYALQKGYILDGKGTQLERDVLSELTDVKGKPAKVRITNNGVVVHYRKESLTIPDKLLGKKLSNDQKQNLINGNIITLSTKKGDVFLQVDREINSVIIRSEKELSIPAQIGGYELTAADKCLLANGFSLDNKILHTPEGYLIANVAMNADKKGFSFSNMQSISEAKANELLRKPIEESQEQKVTPERNLDVELKDAVNKGDYEKLAELKDEGYKPSEDVIRNLGQDTKVDDKSAVVIERLFGVKPEVTREDIRPEKESEVVPERSEVKESVDISRMDSDFKLSVENGNFDRVIQLKEEGYKLTKEMMQSLSATVPENTLVAVQKIFGMKIPAANLGDVKLAQSNNNNRSGDLSRSLGNTVNKIFGDL